MALNSKQQMFVDSYLQCFNRTKAAIDAGYSEKTAYSIGAELLKKPEIQEAISQRLTETAMSADEVIRRLGDQARGTVQPFLVQREDSNNISIDLTTPQAKANLHLIKKISQKHTIRTGKDDEEIEDTTLSIEMYDSQGALNTLAKHHGLLTDYTGRNGEKDKMQVELSGEVGYNLKALTIDEMLEFRRLAEKAKLNDVS